MLMITWLTENIVEVFGAATGIAYVILEIRRNIFLWPLGILTSAVYIYIFGTNGFYAGMVLQGYYVVISIYGWYKWQGARSMLTNEVRQSREAGGHGEEGSETAVQTDIKRIDRKTALMCLVIALGLWGFLWFSLDRWTDSPVPLWDGLITSLSVVATWMLTRKYLEQWYVWIVANAIALIVYLAMEMYPTAVLFGVYSVMAVIGLNTWRKTKDKSHKTKVMAHGTANGNRQ